MRYRILFFLFVAFCLTAKAQHPYDEAGWLPAKGDHFVYDYYGLLTEGQTDSLEFALREFNDSTSNQIVVVITGGFGGRDVSSFAFEVGNSWGIGQSEHNNGVVIVVKPKDDTDGETWIATGDGLEGVLPDIFCKHIVEDEMIPFFRDDDYYGGICAALDVILPVCAGEYSYDEYRNSNSSNDNGDDVAALIAVCVIGLVVWRLRRKQRGGGGGFHWSSGGWSGGSSHSSWSGGSSISGRSFGGGHFGGGGAGGRW